MARIFLSPGETYGTIGSFSQSDVFGTNDAETVYVAVDGLGFFDSTFNRGGDTIIIDGDAGLFDVVLSGSRIILTNDDGANISIPVGTAGATIAFDDAELTLLYDGSDFLLGDQILTDTVADVDPMSMAAAAASATFG